MVHQLNRISLILSAIMALFVSISNAATEVTLRERVVPKNSVVRLNDVAEIVSADRQQARTLAVVPLMPAPAPGTERFLRKREVVDMITASGVEIGDIRFSGPDQVAVAGPPAVRLASAQEAVSTDVSTPANLHAAILAGTKVPPAKSAAAATPSYDPAEAESLQDQYENIIGDYVASKTGQSEPRRIACNVSAHQLAQLAEATSPPTCEGGDEPWTGRQKFMISFTTASGPIHVPVCADVAEPAMPVVVAIRPVARGDVITGADIDVRKLEPSAKAGQRTAIDSVEKVVGMEARQPLQPGDVVYNESVSPPLLVKRGDVVTAVSQSGGIRVRTTAKACRTDRTALWCRWNHSIRSSATTHGL